jgi:hypothetical protein
MGHGGEDVQGKARCIRWLRESMRSIIYNTTTVISPGKLRATTAARRLSFMRDCPVPRQQTG